MQYSPVDRVDVQRIDSALTTKYHQFVIYSEIDAPRTIAEALELFLPEIEANSWPERMAWGGVYYNGRICLTDQPITAPMKIEYYEPKCGLAEHKKSFPEFKKEYIIYEDQDIIVVYKPAGLPSQTAKEQVHHSLYHWLTNYLGFVPHQPSRLDFSTFGLVLASKNPEYHGATQNLFSQRKITKLYLLMTDAKPLSADPIPVKNFFTTDPRHPVLRRPVESGKVLAETIFYPLQPSKTGNWFFLARPLTGRTHQIRIHTNALGGGIVGDNFYGGPVAKDLHLLSYQMRFNHPRTNELIDLKVPVELLPYWVEADPKLLEKIRDILSDI